MSNVFDSFAPQPDRNDLANEVVPTGLAGEPTFGPLDSGSGPVRDAVPEAPHGPPRYPNTTAQKPRSGSGSRWGLIITLVLLVAVGGGGFTAWSYFNENEKRPVVTVDLPKQQDPPKVEAPMATTDTFETWMIALNNASLETLNTLDPDDPNTEFGKVRGHLAKWGCSPGDIKCFLDWAASAKHQNRKLASRIRYLQTMCNAKPPDAVVPGAPSSTIQSAAPIQLRSTTFPWAASLLSVLALQPQLSPNAEIVADLLSRPLGLSTEQEEDWTYSVEQIQDPKKEDKDKLTSVKVLAEIAKSKGQLAKASALLERGQSMLEQANIPEIARAEMEREQRLLMQQQIAIVTAANQQLTDSLKVTPALLRAELAELNAIMRLSELDPQKLSRLPADVVDQYKARWDLLTMQPAQLEQQLTEAETNMHPMDAQKFRTGLRRLREQLVALSIDYSRLQLSPVLPVLQLVTDRAALNKQAGLINARMLDLAEKKIDTTKLAPLQKRLVDLQPELAAMAPLSVDQGVRLFAELQSLDAETTTLQLAVPSAAQPQVPGAQVTFAKSGMIDLLQRLNLDAKSLQDLKPKDLSSPSQQLWMQLEADLKAVQQRLKTPPGEFTSQEYAEITSKLSGVVYAANRLQAEKELAAAATIPGSGPGPDPRVAALMGRVTTLESAKPPVDVTAKVTENSNSIANLNASVATAQKSIEALKNKSVAVTLDANQLDEIRRKVEQSLKNNPSTVPPDFRPDPPLAREYAAPAYHYYYDRNLGKAYQQFTLASQADPYNPAYRYFLALILFEQGRFSDALKEAQNGRHLEQRGKSNQISTLLQKVQGPSRVWLEEIRMRTKLPGSVVARNL